MTVSSFMVPAAGVVTAPILARGLSIEGRGALATATAPAILMLAVATLGLPDAITYFLARQPELTRAALKWATVITSVLGSLCVVIVWLLQGFLSAGDSALGDLIVFASITTVFALPINVCRGAAIGRQMFFRVALEKFIVSSVRVIGLVALFATGHLTVLSAVVLNAFNQISAGVVYWPLFKRYRGPVALPESFIGATDNSASQYVSPKAVAPAMISFGSRVWLGSVASLLLARLAPLLMTPLSGVETLGIYSVASTIADLPLVVTLAIQGAVFGFNSKSRDTTQLTMTGRLTLIAAIFGCGLLGGSLPFWIGPLFGDEFRPATLPTILLLISAIVCIPGLIAAVGLTAWGRPGLRSLGLVLTLVVNLAAFVILVPPFGVYGACLTSIITNLIMSTYMILCSRKVLNVPARLFFQIKAADMKLAVRECSTLFRGAETAWRKVTRSSSS